MGDDFQCVDIDYQYCWDEDKMVKDRTCIFSVDFDCKKKKPYDGKGAVQCEKTPTKKCYDTPRKVQEEICKPQTSKYCEKFTNEFPYPVEKQNCHTEPMKKCELESRTRPKRPRSTATSRWRSARKRRRNTASRWRRRSGRRCAPPRRSSWLMILSVMFKT